MSNKDYYGREDNVAISYLEFGSINQKEKTKKIWGYWQDQEAYDLYMFARYARDLFNFREYISGDRSIEGFISVIKNSAHDKVLDYLFKYAGVISALDSVEIKGEYICESGSSLYGLIEETQACDAIFHESNNIDRIRKAQYVASDISDLMNKGAVAFHRETHIIENTASTYSALVEEIKKLNIRLSLFYGLGVSVRYAIRGPEDLINLAEISELQVYNRISFSYEDTIEGVYGTGKTVYIISLPEFVSLVEKNGLIAKYCTSNMQFDRDGENTVRASIILSRDQDIIQKFISEYNWCVEKLYKVERIDKYEWKDLKELLR